MPGQSYNPPTDTNPRGVRNSAGIEVRFHRNRAGISNRRGSAIPLPEGALRSVPDHIGEPWRSQHLYSVPSGQVQVNARPARVPTSAHFSPTRDGFNNDPTHLISSNSQSPVVDDGSAHLNAGSAHPEARGRYPLRSVSIYSYPRSNLDIPTPIWQDTATSIQMDRFSSNTDVRHTPGEILVNTSATDGWPLGLGSSSTERSSSLNPVDFRELEYVDAVDQNLVCPICQCPMVEPAETECGHTFCSQCLRSAMDHQYDEKTCPSCRNSFHPANLDPINRLVDRMLDDLVVRCVSKSKGCLATLVRSNILDHVDRHCGFSNVPCPDTSCPQVLQRRQLTDDHCHHGSAICEYCPEVMPELELEDHVRTSCLNRVITCHECESEMHTDQAEKHKSICPEAIIPCGAAPYGCTFASKREVVATHATVCPLSMLRPHLEAQHARFEHYESILERMRRQNDVYKEFMVTVEGVLARRAPSPMPGVPPYHGLSQPAHSHSEQVSHEPTNHLLSLHQSLHEDVARLRNAVSEVDARASTISINDNLRHAEEMSHLNATIASLRTQVQWLITSQRQRNEQRALRSQGSGGNGQLLPGPQEGTSTDQDGGGMGLGSLRRPSDPYRNDPKL